MESNLQFTADLATFTEEILNKNLIFCAVESFAMVRSTL